MFSMCFKGVLKVFLVLFSTTLHDFPQFTTLRMDSLKCLYMDGANTLHYSYYHYSTYVGGLRTFYGHNFL